MAGTMLSSTYNQFYKTFFSSLQKYCMPNKLRFLLLKSMTKVFIVDKGLPIDI
jgi:hypothetical protein